MSRFLTAVFVLVVAVSLHAQLAFMSPLSAVHEASGTYQQLTVSTAAIGLSQATTQSMSACSFTIESNPIRFRIDQPPTATVGTPMVAGDTVVLQNILDARSVRFIRSGAADAVVNANCWQ